MPIIRFNERKQGTLGLALLLFTLAIQAQNALPVLNAQDINLSIRDGQTFMKDYWAASPDIELDVYRASRTSQSKTVTFYSDIDSLGFQLKPGQIYDFYVIVNGKDTCLTRLESDAFTTQVTELTSDTLPFELTDHNNIVVKAVMNRSDTLRLMFHTDARAIALTSVAVRRMQEMHFDDSVNAMSWGGENASAYSLNNHFALGEMQWDSLTVWQDLNSGHGTDGKFGPHLFEDKVIELNYDERLLIIHSKLPGLSDSFQQMPIHFSGESMFVDGAIQLDGQRLENRFLIHTGYSGALLLDDVFAAKHALSERLEIRSEKELKDAFGNSITTKEALLPSFSVGIYSVQSIPVGFFEGTVGSQRMSLIGADFLKRFNVMFDLQQAFIYLSPSKDYVIAFEGE